MDYKTLEQQITELWKSRDLNVQEIKVGSVGLNMFEWTITAEGVPSDPPDGIDCREAGIDPNDCPVAGECPNVDCPPAGVCAKCGDKGYVKSYLTLDNGTADPNHVITEPCPDCDGTRKEPAVSYWLPYDGDGGNYRCSRCGFIVHKWHVKCPDCGVSMGTRGKQ